MKTKPKAISLLIKKHRDKRNTDDFERSKSGTIEETK